MPSSSSDGWRPRSSPPHTVELHGLRARDSKPLSAEELGTLEAEIISTESDAVKEAGEELTEEEDADARGRAEERRRRARVWS